MERLGREKEKPEPAWANPMEAAVYEAASELWLKHSTESLSDLDFGPRAQSFIDQLVDETDNAADGYQILAHALIGHEILERDEETGRIVLGEQGLRMVEYSLLDGGEEGARLVFSLSGINQHHFCTREPSNPIT